MDAPQLAAVLQAAEAAGSSEEAVPELEHALAMQQQQGLQHQPLPQQQDRNAAVGLAGVQPDGQQEAAGASLQMAVLTSAARLLEAKVTMAHGSNEHAMCCTDTS